MIKLITQFCIYDFFRKNDNNISGLFWQNIFSTDFLIPFFKKLNLENDNKIKFLLKNIDIAKNNINIYNSKFEFPHNIYFSFLIFNKIISYINSYYSSSNIEINISKGLIFKYNSNDSIDNIINDINDNFLSDNNLFVNELIKPVIKNKLKLDKISIISLIIFWPNEVIGAMIISKILKQENKNNKILLDLSYANEQFDFSQWNPFIENYSVFFNKYFDFFTFYKDFGEAVNSVKKIKTLDEENFKQIPNLGYFSKGYYKYNEPVNRVNAKSFINFYLNKNNISKIIGSNSITGRLFPYRCYWNKCNFCIINSQIKLSYNKDYGYDYFINKWIEFIEKNKIGFIEFFDEAIPPIIIINFAKIIIKRKIKLRYRFRTRFDKIFTKKNCEILYKSGVRYIGIGLESGSTRVNEDIGNKGERNILICDKIKIIHNFEQAGISFHNYSILGFPTETKEESLLTYTFLAANIKNSNHYTSTPNIFGLMKGSYIYNNKEEFGIEIDEKNLKDPFNLILNFENIGPEKRNNLLHFTIAEKIHKMQFLPWLENNKNRKARIFWDFIDRSFLFSKIKISYRKNPFREFYFSNKYFENKNILEKKDLEKKFNLLTSFEILNNDGEYIELYERITDTNFKLPLIFMNFLNNYNNNFSLFENLINNNIDVNTNNKQYLLTLIKNRILTLK